MADKNANLKKTPARNWRFVEILQRKCNITKSPNHFEAVA